MENPFKYGTIVEADYFTDRINEVKYISQFVHSANHLIPRLKTSSMIYSDRYEIEDPFFKEWISKGA